MNSLPKLLFWSKKRPAISLNLYFLFLTSLKTSKIILFINKNVGKKLKWSGKNFLKLRKTTVFDLFRPALTFTDQPLSSLTSLFSTLSCCHMFRKDFADPFSGLYSRIPNNCQRCKDQSSAGPAGGSNSSRFPDEDPHIRFEEVRMGKHLNFLNGFLGLS